MSRTEHVDKSLVLTFSVNIVAVQKGRARGFVAERGEVTSVIIDND